MGDQISIAWEEAPAVSRALAVVPLGFHLAGFVFGQYLQIACSLSLLAVKQGRIWTLLTAALWQPPQGLLSTIFACLLAFWVLTGVKNLERAAGSSRLLVSLFTASVLINVCFLLLMGILDVIWKACGWLSMWPFLVCQGIVPLAIYGITMRSLEQPDAYTSFFGVSLRQKYYPFVLVGVFGLISGPAIFQDIAALAAAGIALRLRLGDRLSPTDSTLTRWEYSGMLFGRNLFGGRWISVREAFGGTAFGGDGGLPTTQGYTPIGRPRFTGNAPVQRVTGGTQFVMFSGSGQRLGSG